MPKFSRRSIQRLESCHMDLQLLFSMVVRGFDCTIIEGYRSKERQIQLFYEGKTKLKLGKHNQLPSLAVDVAPYPIDFGDVARMRYFAGYVQGVASVIGVNVRWGGDWDMDTEVNDNRFNDLVHFELVEG